MSALAEDQIKLLRIWAENAVQQVKAVQTFQGMGDWVAANGQRLGELAGIDGAAWQRIRVAIDVRWRELT